MDGTWRGGGSKVTDVTLPACVPNNTGQLFSSEYYSQFNNWYAHMSKHPTERSLDHIAWIANFKFDFECKSYQELKTTTGKNGYQNGYCGGGGVGYNSKNSNSSQRGNGNSSGGNRNNSTGNYESNSNGSGDRS